MTNEELNAAVYKKMDAEQTDYIGWLLKLPPEEILEHSFSYTVRRDILMTMEENVLSDEQAEALLQSDTPLTDVYTEFQKQETGYMDVVRDCIVSLANSELRKNQERRDALRNLPVYPYSAKYACDNGELDKYWLSQNACIACREAIEQAIGDHYADNRLDTTAAVQQVADAFGYDRMLYVLAVTVQHKNWDGRISSSNKEWAASVPIYEDEKDGSADQNVYMIVDKVHTGLMDLFLKEALRRQAQEQYKAQAAEKPSMLARLRDASVKTSPKHSAKSKEPEL